MRLRIIVFQAHVDTITEMLPVERVLKHVSCCNIRVFSTSRLDLQRCAISLCNPMTSDVIDALILKMRPNYGPSYITIPLHCSLLERRSNRVVINHRYTRSKPREVITKCIHLSHFPPQSSFHRFRIQVDFYDSDTRKMRPGFDCYRSTMQRFVRTAMHVHPPRILGSSDGTTGLCCLSSFFYVIFTENCCPDNWYCTFIGVVDHTNK